MAFGYDDAAMILTSILGGVAGSQNSPQENATQNALDTLKANQDYFKSTPFSKEEIMQVLLPQVQKMYKGASDVVAGKVGAATGEAGMALGQPTSQYFLQSLAPIISQGENLAASSVSEFGQWFTSMDQNAKDTFLKAISLELQGAQGLPDMNTFQRTITGALSGLNIGSTAVANLDTANALNKKNDILSNLYKTMTGDSSANSSIQSLSAKAQSNKLLPEQSLVQPY